MIEDTYVLCLEMGKENMEPDLDEEREDSHDRNMSNNQKSED